MRAKSIEDLDLPMSVRLKNRHLFPADSPYLPQTVEKIEKATNKLEAKLQSETGLWLHHREGYASLTAENAQKAASGEIRPVAWYGHLVNAKKNPLLPDWFIFDHTGRRPQLLVELKVRDVWQPGQREMCGTGFWQVCWTFDEFVNVVKEWEGVNCESEKTSTECREESDRMGIAD